MAFVSQTTDEEIKYIVLSDTWSDIPEIRDVALKNIRGNMCSHHFNELMNLLNSNCIRRFTLQECIDFLSVVKCDLAQDIIMLIV